MIKLKYDDCGFSKAQITGVAKGLIPRIRQLQEVLKKKDYSDDSASIILPRDDSHLESVRKAAKEFRNAELVVVVGIGGSNLGTVAVQEAALGKLHNLRRDLTRIVYADTVDSDNLSMISEAINYYLSRNRKVLVNVISKSGMTTETIANFQVLLERIQETFPRTYKEFVVITSDEGSKFDILAEKLEYARLTIPKHVGGRYSAFSAVGLLPLAVVGVDVEQLLKGASDALRMCLDDDVKNNPAAIIASLMYLHYKKGRKIHDHFVWSNDLESAGKWYRQLLGESIGKEWNAKKTRKIKVGITPTVSVGSTDLHSVGQLYLGGPDDKFFRFVTVEKSRTNVTVPKMPFFDLLVRGAQGKSADELLWAIINGVQKAFSKKKLPFIELALPDKSEYHIGQLMQIEMIEVMLLGQLFDVNPFNQPNVEDYKEETRKILEGR